MGRRNAFLILRHQCSRAGDDIIAPANFAHARGSSRRACRGEQCECVRYRRGRSILSLLCLPATAPIHLRGFGERLSDRLGQRFIAQSKGTAADLQPQQESQPSAGEY
jgi:hypothetical protein